MKAKIEKLMRDYEEDTIRRHEFVNEISKYIDNSDFVDFLQRNLSFGSIEADFDAAVKFYNREAEINKTAKFLADNEIEVSDSIKVIEKKVSKRIAEKSVVRKAVVKKTYNKSEIMKRAWEIAREGQTKFGGKVKEFFSESLKSAWAEAKA